MINLKPFFLVTRTPITYYLKEDSFTCFVKLSKYVVCHWVKKPPANTGDAGSDPRLGRSPGGENGNLLKYSCLENFMDREPGRLQIVELDMTEELTVKDFTVLGLQNHCRW